MLLATVIVFFAATIIFSMSQLILLIQAFRINIGWGLLSLFVPITSVIVSLQNWKKRALSRIGLSLYAGGGAAAFISFFTILISEPMLVSNVVGVYEELDAIDQERMELLFREDSGSVSGVEIADTEATLDRAEEDLSVEAEAIFRYVFLGEGSLGSPYSDNPFQDALSIGAQAANDTQVAETKEDWAAIAYDWQQAINLLLQVPISDPNYVQAQTRIMTYTQNMEYAQSLAR
ncbi:MAG: hypothetical protein AAFY72_03745 [Cyanobacteria bacterium J06649_4]